nr:FKBP-type peptidyl-prolyl cis-trans isomerase [uncultured Sphingomonas sp.]
MSVTAVPLQPVKRAYKVWLWIGVLLAIALAFGLAWLGTREQVAAKLPNDQFLAWHKGQTGIQTTPSGLQYQVLKAGTGPTANDQDGVSLQIHGTLRDGSEFQSAAPMRFQVGQPMIPGFTEGVKLMNKGSKFRFWLPPKLGYGAEPGAQGPGAELADKVLIFDVEMSEVVPAAVIQQMMMQQMMQQQQRGGAPGGPPQGAGGPPPQVAPGQ